MAFGIRSPFCSHVPAHLSLGCDSVRKSTMRTILCNYGSCGASIAPAARAESKATLSQPGKKNLMWKRAKEHEGKLEPMSLLPPPALMSRVTCRRNWYIAPRAAYAVPRIPKAQGGDPLSTREATGLTTTSHPPTQLADQYQLGQAAYLLHTVHSPPEGNKYSSATLLASKFT